MISCRILTDKAAAAPSTHLSDYQRADSVHFLNFNVFATQHLSASRLLSTWPHDDDDDESPDIFQIEVTSVACAAEGLRIAIIGAAQDKHAILNPQKNGVALAEFLPRNICLGKLFSYAILVCQVYAYFYTYQEFLITYQVFRGHEDNIDIVGNGVLQQVLDEALQQCLTFEEGLVEELENGDGYISLKISADGIVDTDRLHKFFALGALCTIFMIKMHNRPEPISPALIQAAIGGINSILELSWIQAISPPVAEILSLIPTNPTQAIPNQPRIDHFIKARLPGTQVSISAKNTFTYLILSIV
jgi:hypothetical protein